MEHARTPNVLSHVVGDLFHLAPIPIVYHRIARPDLASWHSELIREARRAMPEAVLEVPDVRHVRDMGKAPRFDHDTWSEDQIAPVGVWHRVPTNNFLNLEADVVKELRAAIENRYLSALSALERSEGRSAWISESWIQFYKNGDYKVLHNHERYGPPYPTERWAGAYYMDAGDPDSTMPYSGMFSFSIRGTSYYVRPEPGLLMMWPADILHEVHPFYGARERVVVNFNINARS